MSPLVCRLEEQLSGLRSKRADDLNFGIFDNHVQGGGLCNSGPHVSVSDAFVRLFSTQSLTQVQCCGFALHSP